MSPVQYRRKVGLFPTRREQALPLSAIVASLKSREENMGRSNAIEDQTKKNQEFQAYLNQMENDLQKRADKAWEAINKDVTEHYSKYNNEFFDLAKGEYKHLTTLSEWSLDNVNRMIDSIQGALFGKIKKEEKSDDKDPKGSKIISKEEITKNPELSQSMLASSSQQLLIASTAFMAIQGILESFTSSTKTELMSESKIVSLSPGLTLFLYVIENNVKEEQFFKTDLICQNFYLYTAKISIREAKTIVDFNHLQALADVEAGMDVQLQKIAKIIAALDPSSEKYEEQQIKYDKLVGNLKKSRSNIQEEINLIKAA
ncbi:hypothetical protein [Microcoleus sp. herbarium12]|uniref:hypothetical protein n=1 Tax=Microcoleus sp. herbarium12 TaxID=3055437 RepID=UPI002FD68602